MYQTNDSVVWRMSIMGWMALLVAAASFVLLFHRPIAFLLTQWETPEYNYGYLIPFISMFLIWQKRDALQRSAFQGSWLGIAVIIIGILLLAAGRLSSIFSITAYAMVLSITGLALSLVGQTALRNIAIAFLMLLFMVPLPGFLYGTLSNQLQLLSSSIGVWFIRLFGISVYLEGNVIDLGTMKLQVVEACSGLRYLFPLMTLGFIAAYFFKTSMWKRAVVFLSTIPITVFMNSFRIGVIGILVEHFGESQAEGFLHDFEGWIIFMACTAVLLLEMWLLTAFGQHKRPLGQVFGIEMPARARKDAEVRRHPVSTPFLTAVVLFAVVAVAGAALPERKEIVPSRADFSQFPVALADWRGEKERIEAIYFSSLNFDDYLMANYARSGSPAPPVNVYVGYYGYQRAEKVPHSPRACLPSGGWAVTEFGQRQLSGIHTSDGVQSVNRVVIEQGSSKQLVYYWFKQRNRTITNEYVVKWYIFWDALTRRRTDGALVRLVTPVFNGEELAVTDSRLASFASLMVPILPAYVPD